MPRGRRQKRRKSLISQGLSWVGGRNRTQKAMFCGTLKMLSRLIVETKKGQMFGEWNDYGRLVDY